MACPTPFNDQDPTLAVGFLIPDSPEWKAIIRGAIANLTDESYWSEWGISVERAIEIVRIILFSLDEDYP